MDGKHLYSWLWLVRSTGIKPMHHFKTCNQSLAPLKGWYVLHITLIWQWKDDHLMAEIVWDKWAASLVRRRRRRWEFWFFLELLLCWQQHEHAPPVFDSTAVTYHRAQQFVNKSKRLPRGYRAVAFIFRRLCSVPFLCCAHVIQALAKPFALVIYTISSFSMGTHR